MRKAGPHRQRLPSPEHIAGSVRRRPHLLRWEPELNGEPRPHRERQLSPLETLHTRRQTQDWLTEGVVEPAPLTTAWVNNLVFVAKKDGRIRVCVDCTPANEVTNDLGWPLPRLQDIRHRLVGANMFTRIDLRNAFFRITVPPQFRYLTTFRSDGKPYWFVRMPFGLKTAPEVFQRMMDHLLAAYYEFAYWYMDDILVWGSDEAQLRARTKAIQATLGANQQEINEAKSAYYRTSLLFAGIWVTPRTIGPNLDKIRSLLRIPAPRTKVDAQSALGLASYLRDFIPLASMLTARMSGEELEPSEYEKLWGQFIEHVTRTLTTLSAWDAGARADLYTDASLTACAALLIQDQRIIAMASRKFTPTETRYSATDREHLGLLLGARKFRLFLQRTGPQTMVWTDHKALLRRRMTELSPRQARWRLEINLSITNLGHVKGKENPADFFSRMGAVDNWGPTMCI